MKKDLPFEVRVEHRLTRLELLVGLLLAVNGADVLRMFLIR